MAFNLNDFKTRALRDGGYRPSLFEVSIRRAGTEFTYLCQATSVPALTMGTIEVPYFGRKIKLAGDRTYADWSTTVLVDEKFNGRKQLEEWSMKMNSFEANLRELVGNDYKAEDVKIKLYGKNGQVVRVYTLVGAWPSEVGTMTLDWNSTDQIGTYDVTWTFDYMDQGSEG